MYAELRSKGFEILDFPCNQFGQQAPESDEEYVEFCQLHYNTEFTQFHKIEVNGDGESLPTSNGISQNSSSTGKATLRHDSSLRLPQRQCSRKSRNYSDSGFQSVFG